jgi:ribosome-binding protein aMBF1 (putative translation factor)
MIKNERQYRVTQAQARRFEEALERLGRAASDKKLHPRLRQAQADAVRGQLAELRAELAEYDDLRSGSRRTIQWRSLEALADLLIKARIAAGLTQRELAERLGLKEQQVQRYEATSYASASLARLIEVAGAVGIEFSGDVALPGAPESHAGARSGEAS